MMVNSARMSGVIGAVGFRRGFILAGAAGVVLTLMFRGTLPEGASGRDGLSRQMQHDIWKAERLKAAKGWTGETGRLQFPTPLFRTVEPMKSSSSRQLSRVPATACRETAPSHRARL